MEKSSVTKATLGRLPAYLELLRGLPAEEHPYISATTIAKMLSLGEVQVRKDLAAVSGAGKPRLGYVTSELIGRLEECLGCGRATPAVLVGAGKLGRALFQYDGFEKFGVKIVAAFDKAGFGEENGVWPMERFEAFCRDEGIRLGIITVSREAAQEVCDRMVKCGITAIWNFVPCKLWVPPGVLLQNENLALSLAYLNNQLCDII